MLCLVYVADEGEIESKPVNNTAANEDETNSIINVPQIFDENFSTFFGTNDSLHNNHDIADFNTDLNEIKSEVRRLL